MELALDKLNAEDVLHKLVNLGVGQLPFGGGFVNYLVDTVIFPSPEVDLWKEVEGKVAALVKERIDDMVMAAAGARLPN